MSSHHLVEARIDEVWTDLEGLHREPAAPERFEQADRDGRLATTGAQVLFLLIVASFVYGSCVYHFARLGYLRRIADHVPARDDALASVYGEASPPLVTMLVPSYMEDERVVRRTLLSAAL